LRDRTRIIAVALLSLSSAAAAQKPAEDSNSAHLSYADLADTFSPAPVVAVATVTKSKRLKGDLAAGLQEGRARFLVTAKLSALIRSKEILPEKVDYLVDTPTDAKGRPPKLNKRKVILAANPVPGKPASLGLTSPRSQLDWSPQAESQIRAIVTEAVGPDSPPRIVGVGSAFHVKGSLPGESETQIFLKTVGDKPVSLSVLRRPGETPRWAVALGEMIDESGKAPEVGTLLWYRLACFLPSTLPESSVSDLAADDALAASEDYRTVITGLGPCNRSASR
jgi:hypothetical protein